jgi:hypothetical protein
VIPVDTEQSGSADVQVINPNKNAPIQLRFEIFNTTVWCADTFETAQPLIKESLVKAFTKPPLQAFGPPIKNQAGAGSELPPAVPPSGEQVHDSDKGWTAPSWFLPVVACSSAGAFVLLLAACLCLYRRHTYRKPPVFIVKSADASSTVGSFQTVGPGLLRHPESSVDPSRNDGGEGESGSLLATGRRDSSAMRVHQARRTHSHPGSESSPRTSGVLQSGGLAPVSTINTKTRIMGSLNSIEVTNDQGGVTNYTLDAAGAAHRWWPGPTTESSDTTKIPRGSPAGLRSGTASKGSKTSSKGAESAVYDSAGGSGSDNVALDMVRAEVHAAVQQMQVRTSLHSYSLETFHSPEAGSFGGI